MFESSKSQLVYFLFGSVARVPGNQYGHKQLGMERTTTSSLVPFQLFQPGRNKLRHALRARQRKQADGDGGSQHVVEHLQLAVFLNQRRNRNLTDPKKEILKASEGFAFINFQSQYDATLFFHLRTGTY